MMIYLEEDQYRQLRAAAASRGATMAGLIREAVSRLLARDRTETDYFSFIGVAEGPPEGNTSERYEEILGQLLRNGPPS